MKTNRSKAPKEGAEITKAKTYSLAVVPNPKQKPPASTKAVELKRHFFRKRKRKNGPEAEQIKQIVLDNIDVLPENEAQMLHGIFSFSGTTVREIMIPLSEVMAVHIATPIEQVKVMVYHSNYRYIPVYEERIDRLIGIVSIMDLLYVPSGATDLSSFVRDAYYIPETKPIGDLLEELRPAEEPVAVVIDEHGGCVGFVGLEDLLEQIVGEIGDNHKRHSLHVEQLGNNSWMLDARTPIDIVNMTLGTNIPKEFCDTIGGFLLKIIGRLPEPGEKVTCEAVEFTVDEVFDYGIAVIHASRNSVEGFRQKAQ